MGQYLVLLLMQIGMLIIPGCLGETGSLHTLELENLKGAVDLAARSGKEKNNSITSPHDNNIFSLYIVKCSN